MRRRVIALTLSSFVWEECLSISISRRTLSLELHVVVSATDLELVYIPNFFTDFYFLIAFSYSMSAMFPILSMNSAIFLMAFLSEPVNFSLTLFLIKNKSSLSKFSHFSTHGESVLNTV